MLLQSNMTSLNALIEAAKIVETKRDQRVTHALRDIGFYESEKEEPMKQRHGGRPNRRPGGSGTREVHNELEKNRRAHMKECFEKLRTQIPVLEDRKASNLSILSGAFEFIEQLKKEDRKYEEERERLYRAKICLQERRRMLTSDIHKQLPNQQLIIQVQKTNHSSGSTIVIIKAETDLDDSASPEPGCSKPLTPTSSQPNLSCPSPSDTTTSSQTVDKTETVVD